MDVGLLYMLPNALAIALINSWPEQPMTSRPISWITIMVLVYAIIAPAPPRKMLPVSLIAATMDPLGVWIAHLRGLPVPSIVPTFLMFLPNYVCAALAILPYQVLKKLGRQIRSAQQMGSYRLVELLGRGGMGEVWRAHHRLLARHAAIKLVRPEMLGAGTDADTRTVMRRFEREAQATAVLSSPHSIHLFDFGITEDGMFYYVMELLTGRDMESLVREFGPVPADRALYLLRQVSHSLADAHARDLVHRDIKPANVYVCRMGLEYDFVKVLDFGLVKQRHHDGRETTMSAEHGTAGTPAYMAPEVILGEGEVDRRADVYSLGCLAYFLLTGHLVFEGETAMKIIVQQVHGSPVPPSERTEIPIPAELERIVMACLKKDPDKRPQDALAVFDMACACSTCNVWTNQAARSWWEQHLPELTGPLMMPAASTRADVSTQRVAVS